MALWPLPLLIPFRLLAHLIASGVHGKCAFKEVNDKYVQKSKSLDVSIKYPVILRHGVSHLSDKTNKETVLSQLGNLSISVTKRIEAQAVSGVKQEAVTMTIRDWERSAKNNSGIKYVFSWLLDDVHAELDQKLLNDYPMPEYLRPYGISRFAVMGLKTPGIALHKHQMSWVGLLSGQKHWFVFPPTAKLPQGFSGKRHKAKELKQTPGVVYCVQEASDIIILPVGWWHATFDASDFTMALGSQVETRVSELDFAASTGNVSALRDAPGSESMLQVAAQAGHAQVVDLLIGKRVPMAESLHQASRRGHVELVEMLIARRAEINQVDQYGMPPLGFASTEGKPRVLQALIKHRASINTKTTTALHYAAAFGHVEGVKVLLDQRADVRALASNSWTPLHEVALNGHSLVAAALMEHGADAFAKAPGYTPYDIAKGEGHTEILRILNMSWQSTVAKRSADESWASWTLGLMGLGPNGGKSQEITSEL